MGFSFTFYKIKLILLCIDKYGVIFLKKFLPAIAIISAGVLWGLIGMFVRFLNGFGFTGFEITAARGTATFVILFVYILIKDKSLFKIKLKHIWYFFGTGILSFVLFNICYMYTISVTSIAVTGILLYTAPIFVMIMSVIFFKEKLTAKKLIALSIAFLGCVLVTGIGGEMNLPLVGLLTGLGSGIGYALYTIFGRVALKHYHPITVTFYTFAFVALGTLPFLNYGHIGNVTAGGAAPILLLITTAVLTGIVPYVLYTTGLKYTMASTASIMASIEPVVAAVSGVIIFGETIPFVGIIGICCVIAAIVLLNINTKATKANSN